MSPAQKIAWAAIVVVALGCATRKPPSVWLVADEFMRQMQWQRYDGARPMVPKEKQKDFRKWSKKAEKDALNISEYEQAELDLVSPTTAVTRYEITYTAAPEYLQKTTDVEMRWELDEFTWRMIEAPNLDY